MAHNVRFRPRIQLISGTDIKLDYFVLTLTRSITRTGMLNSYRGNLLLRKYLPTDFSNLFIAKKHRTDNNITRVFISDIQGIPKTLTNHWARGGGLKVLS